MGPRTLPATPSIVETLVLAQRRAVRGLAARLADDGCTLDQWRVLRALDDDEGHVMGELADSLQIAQPTLTRVVDGLVDSAWVYRRPSLEDRRRVAVHLSRQGRVRLGRLDEIVRAHEDALRASPDWADVQTLISGLSRTP
jgi:DNA-binding MarR family transcriptional regulator